MRMRFVQIISSGQKNHILFFLYVLKQIDDISVSAISEIHKRIHHNVKKSSNNQKWVLECVRSFAHLMPSYASFETSICCRQRGKKCRESSRKHCAFKTISFFHFIRTIYCSQEIVLPIPIKELVSYVLISPRAGTYICAHHLQHVIITISDHRYVWKRITGIVLSSALNIKDNLRDRSGYTASNNYKHCF